ncbi:sigma-70 family RNA polymerase sigma factor [Clostridium gasigenes]|uniref:RNA polymerase sigma-70 factor, ECF subfamily n=1 Tax=Clostridium gasigenes TaxID=94869 RepID=A0A1H0UYI1_9CLOT|nr:sigma-70 family RNA polymerase sigma factor [Clostridium gasigenes]MBB6624045.1 sigma-70 family RNA polymerase sigma factor [Clostridium gasigenes]MBU3103321.1 sigma-70 family RNA polymerase sigma factor [Clostridium gasigenes]MBU3137386.1 sigma-70 family RNA polymerase sigma factor [Clostridium gasigenes]SDP71214.1 RNA polymerase sigma-70 factor, ECF subfamily [Clostridium gasigenes]
MVNKDNFIIRLRKKDLIALDYLVDNYSQLVLKVSYSVLNNLDLSEECTNDVMLRAWDNIKSFKGDINMFPKWLVVITKRHAIDIIRKEKKHSKNVCLDDEISINIRDVADEVEDIIAMDVIHSEINNLDNKSKDVIVRRIFKNQKVNEISKELGISETAVSNRLSRGKKKLICALERRG